MQVELLNDDLIEGETIPTHMAGYLKNLNGEKVNHSILAVGGSKYVRLSQQFRQTPIFRRQVKTSSREPGYRPYLVNVDMHTADTTKGASGAPVVLGKFRPSALSCPFKVIAIHPGGVNVGGQTKYRWINEKDKIPPHLQGRASVNNAVRITQDVLMNLGS